MSKVGTTPAGAVYDDISQLYAVYVRGESKTGKGAAGAEVAKALRNDGYNIYYDVAGDFYRRYVALVRIKLGLTEKDALPEGEILEKTAKAVYETRSPYENNDALGDLQRASISNSVSILCKIPFVQDAGGEWVTISVERARKQGAQIIVLEGRNLRERMRKQDVSVSANVVTVLELFLTCDTETAARRTLLGRGIANPTAEQVAAEKIETEARRRKDRERAINPFEFPTVAEELIPNKTPVEAVVRRTWGQHGNAELPVTVILDNSHITKPVMLESVAELAKAAVRFKVEPVPARRSEVSPAKLSQGRQA